MHSILRAHPDYTLYSTANGVRRHRAGRRSKHCCKVATYRMGAIVFLLDMLTGNCMPAADLTKVWPGEASVPPLDAEAIISVHHRTDQSLVASGESAGCLRPLLPWIDAETTICTISLGPASAHQG